MVFIEMNSILVVCADFKRKGLHAIANTFLFHSLQQLRTIAVLLKFRFHHDHGQEGPPHFPIVVVESGEADVRLSCIARIADSLSVAPADLLKPHQ